MMNDKCELLNAATFTQNERIINLKSFKGVLKKFLPFQNLRHFSILFINN